MNKIEFKMAGLTCESCVKLATIKIKKIPGVSEVAIDLATGAASVESEADLDLEIVERSLEGTHYSIVK
jgi:Cu2+-exporting ATPase